MSMTDFTRRDALLVARNTHFEKVNKRKLEHGRGRVVYFGKNPSLDYHLNCLKQMKKAAKQRIGK